MFLSGEAVASLNEWIADRGDFLNLKGHYATNLKRIVDPDDPRAFPFTREATERLFNAALLKSGYCKKQRGKKGEKIPIKDVGTGRSPIHLHGLRTDVPHRASQGRKPPGC